MKTFIVLVSLLAFHGGTLFASDLNSNQCKRIGRRVGQRAGKTFCTALERSYAKDLITIPYMAVDAQKCDVDATIACKDAMAEVASSDFDYCARLVREDWTDSRGKSSYEAWVDFQQSSCYFASPDDNRR